MGTRDWRLGTGYWILGTGDWGLEIGDWRLEIGGRGAWVRGAREKSGYRGLRERGMGAGNSFHILGLI